MMIQILKETILEMIIFHALTDDEIDLLIKKFKRKDYKKDSYICREKDMGNELYVILEGDVSVIKVNENNELYQIAQLHAKDAFGEMTLIDMQPRSASIRCITDTSVAILTNYALYQIYQTNIELYVKIILNISREISRRLRQMDSKLIELS